MTADRLVASLRDGADRLGLAGVVGLGLAACALVWFASAALPERARVDELRARAAALSKAAGTEEAPAPVRAGVEGQLETFYAFFAPDAPVTSALARLEEAAREHGLDFEAAEYRVARETGLRLERHEVSLPLRGSYAQLRGFVGAVLDSLPRAAIEDVALKRDHVGAAQLEARLRLALYVGLR